MAGTFDLFRDVSELHKGQIAKPLSRSKTSLTSTSAVKSLGVPKPKGLSIRSNSDINIPSTPRANLTGKQNTGSNADKDYLKPKLTQLGTNGRPLSPGRDPGKKKKEAVGNKKPKLRKSFNDYCFKKPLPLQKHVKMQGFPEPEKLASYYNFESELENIYMRDLEDEFQELLSQKRKLIKPYEDEGFVSDSEPLPVPKMPSLSISMNSLDNLSIGDDTLSLPDLDMEDLIDDLSAT